MENLINDLLKLSPPLLLALALNLFGWGLRQYPGFNNKWIPLTLMFVGGIVYPFIGKTPENTRAACMVVGFCIGGLSVAINQQFRQFKLPDEDQPTPPAPPPTNPPAP